MILLPQHEDLEVTNAAHTLPVCLRNGQIMIHYKNMKIKI
jgi:hypothetical protein